MKRSTRPATPVINGINGSETPVKGSDPSQKCAMVTLMLAKAFRVWFVTVAVMLLTYTDGAAQARIGSARSIRCTFPRISC